MQDGLLAAMSKAISSVEVNIKSANVRALSDNRALNVFEVMASSVQARKRVVYNLGKVRGGGKVRRGREK